MNFKIFSVSEFSALSGVYIYIHIGGVEGGGEGRDGQMRTCFVMRMECSLLIDIAPEKWYVCMKTLRMSVSTTKIFA